MTTYDFICVSALIIRHKTPKTVTRPCPYPIEAADDTKCLVFLNLQSKTENLKFL